MTIAERDAKAERDSIIGREHTLHADHDCYLCAASDRRALLVARQGLLSLADEMDEADSMRGPGVGEFADRIRTIVAS